MSGRVFEFYSFRQPGGGWFNQARIEEWAGMEGVTILGYGNQVFTGTYALHLRPNNDQSLFAALNGSESPKSDTQTVFAAIYVWVDDEISPTTVWNAIQSKCQTRQCSPIETCGAYGSNSSYRGYEVLYSSAEAPTQNQDPDCGPYKVRLLLDVPVVDSDDPEGGEKEYLLSGNCLQGETSFVKFEVQALQAAWKYKIRRIDLVLTDGPFWGSVAWEAVDKNGNEAGEGSNIPNIGGGREILGDSPYAKGIPLYNGGDNPASMVLDVFSNKHWLCLNVELQCGEPLEPGEEEPIPPEPPEEPVAPVEEEWPTGYGPEDDTLIIVEPPGEVTPPTIVTPPTTGTGPEGCECFEYLAGEIAIQAGYLGEILESVRQEVFISRRENNELLLRIETAILQEAAKNRNNLILRGLELLERLLAMNVDLGPLINELADGKSQSATNADTMKQAIEGLATAIEEASCCEPICEKLEKIAKGVYFDEVEGEEHRSLAMNTNLLLAGLNIWR